MLTRRRFLGYGAAGAAVVAIPTVIVPKAQEAIAAVKSRADDRRQRLLSREAEELHTEDFATTLKPGAISVAHLWTPDGSHGASIWIEKEIWHDLGGHWHERRCRLAGLDPTTTKLPLSFANFHLFNYIDPSKSLKRGWVFRTHSCQEPYLDLRDALVQAIALKDETLHSGDWVAVRKPRRS